MITDVLFADQLTYGTLNCSSKTTERLKLMVHFKISSYNAFSTSCENVSVLVDYQNYLKNFSQFKE